MARVFTIGFEFRNERHIAMVTIREDSQCGPAYHIKLFNSNLYSIIPDGKIYFTSTDNALPEQVQSQLAEALFVSVKTALSDYLSQQAITTVR